MNSTYSDQRFFPFTLNQLIRDIDSPVVLSFIKDCDSIEEIAGKVIRRIKYPFYAGKPDDRHRYNSYHGKWCKVIERDYWDTGEESLTIQIGDCDGASIAFTTCARAFGLSSLEVYETFGVVRDANTKRILGGHAWSIAYWDEYWHLVEATLDTPPKEYPVIPEEKKFEPYQHRNVIYDPEIFYNDERIKRVNPRQYELNGLQYSKMSHQDKETLEKYEAIRDAWRVDTKFTKLWSSSGKRRLVGKIPLVNKIVEFIERI